VTDVNYAGDFAPSIHQQMMARRMCASPIHALTAEMGCGKSRPLLRAWLWRDANQQLATGENVDLVLLAPKGCYLNWLTMPTKLAIEPELGELERWLTHDEFRSTEWCWWGPTSKGHQQKLDALLRVTQRRRFLTMNIEALNRPGKARDYLLAFMKDRHVFVAVDESTCIMHHDSGRTKWVLEEVKPRADYRVIMSGLISPESPENLFSQYKFLDSRILGEHYINFRAKYAITRKINFTPAAQRTKEKPGRAATVIVGWRDGVLEELREKTAPYTSRVLLEDVADIPRSYSYYDVGLTDQQADLYERLKKQATAALDAMTRVTATNAAHQLALLHHIICGHVKAEDGTIHDVPSNRIDSLMEVIGDQSGKAIIFAPYPRALEKITDAIRTAYGEASCVTYWGATSDRERGEARTRIQKDPDTRFIVSNQSVGGKGGTWTAARLVLFFANSWDQEDRQQSEFRARRLGQTGHVHFVDFRARNTVEERLISVLKAKRSMSAELAGDRWRAWLE
jgi:hypothetical protein